MPVPIRAERARPFLPGDVELTRAVFGRGSEGELRWTATRGTLRGGAALERLEVPANSELSPLGIDGTWPALAGDRLDLPFPCPSIIRIANKPAP